MISISDVPRDVKRNLEWRADVLRQAETDIGLREELWIASKRDLLFYVNTFVWTEDPRTNGIIPFATWECQDEIFMEMLKCFGKQDMAIEKSRDMGASWMNIVLFEWRWHFYESQQLGMVSRKEEYVDKRGDPKALFSKVDFIHKWEPLWLLPRMDRRQMYLGNKDNGSVISGETTTGDMFRGGRLTALLMDEFAAFKVQDGYKALSATRDVTRCRIFNSTYQGIYNAFYDVTHKVKGIKVLKLLWTGSPLKRAGLYTSKDGVLEIIDKDYEFPPDYEFILDGKVRSPWYDEEESRCANKYEMAQEVDCDPIGGDYHFFDDAMLSVIKGRDVRMPYSIGDFVIDGGEVVGFSEGETGKCKLWATLKGGKIAGDGNYYVGCDIALGTGATPSVMVAFNAHTGEKVLEYVDAFIRPHDFGKLAVAVCKWLEGFNGETAKLNWEVNGAGKTFTLAVKELGYDLVYHRRDIETGKEQWDRLGWYTDDKTKIVLLTEYRRALNEGDFINRSLQAIEECSDYIRTETTVEHMASKNAQDLDKKGDNHGDRVIADAITWWHVRTDARGMFRAREREKVEMFDPWEYIQQMERNENSGLEW